MNYPAWEGILMPIQLACQILPNWFPLYFSQFICEHLLLAYAKYHKSTVTVLAQAYIKLHLLLHLS
jgi:hypothetical protein